MTTLEKIIKLVEEITVDDVKVNDKGNKEAAKRVRKNAQEIKKLIPVYRSEVLTTIKEKKEAK